MFEDLDSKNKRSLSGNNISSSQEPAPSLPREGVKGVSAPKVEDMFADVKDVSAPARRIGGALPAMPEASSAKAGGDSSNILRNLIIIIIILLILLAGVFLASRFVGSAGLKNLGEQFSNLKGLIIKENKPGQTIIINEEKPAVLENNENNNPAANTPAENIPDNNVPSENIPANSAPNTPLDEPAAASTEITPETPAPAIDSDSDGLPDSEEAVLKTNPLKADSDDDGLTDFQEVKTYLTDPNNADTDGDSYLDGAEVQAGYDPKGPGKLVAQ